MADGLGKQLTDLVGLPASLTSNVNRAAEAIIDIRDQLGSLVDLPREILDAPTPPGAVGPSGAAVWLRPPEPGHEVERDLPSLTALPGLAPSVALAVDGSGTDPHSGSAAGSDLVRLVDTAATACHRVRLRRASSQPLALS